GGGRSLGRPGRRWRARHPVAARARRARRALVTTRVRAYVVDDEPGALKQVVHSLRSTGRVDVVGTATSAETALLDIPARQVEALFLDIHMPGMTGFDLLERLAVSPHAVCVTPLHASASRASGAAGADSRRRPARRARLERTLDRLERRRADPGGTEVQAVLERLARHYREARSPVYADRISVDLGQQRTQLVETAKITHFVAQGKATLAVTASGRHLVDRALAELEERLDPRQFLRIHRSVLLNPSS